MARLQIRLLGSFQAVLDGAPITHFETHKTKALLAYLAAGTEQSHPRELLAEMMWPDRPEGAARANLRHTLANLRSILREPNPSDLIRSDPSMLLITRETIRLNPEADLWVDATAFSGLVTGTIPTSRTPIERLEDAAEIYCGTFLEGFSVKDSGAFQEWILVKREQFQSQVLKILYCLSKCYTVLGDYNRALVFARRQAALAPWDEAAHQQVMQILADSGRQAAALEYYQTCQRVLAEELGVEPGEEIKTLIDQIRSSKGSVRIAPPAVPYSPSAFRRPAFLREEAVPVEPQAFIGREQELARLGTILEDMLRGRTGLAFVVGDAGQGKTALLKEFARLSMDTDPELLVASGNCNTLLGTGDPYLPFRDILEMLTGNVEPRWAAGLIGREHAQRLWETQMLAIEALATSGGSLIDTILPGDPLVARSAVLSPDRIEWLERLVELVRQRRAGQANLEQSQIFEQFTNVLRTLANRRPLVMLIDDLQWADNSSIGLLFHLGRRLSGSRVLLIGAYRPDEIASGSSEDTHPLAKVLFELKRIYGDICLDLNQAGRMEKRQFVDALVDLEPNRLSEAFREALFQRTGGHPLFTIELLRSMQERAELIRESEGRWIETPTLSWDLLPARVEAVIEERIDRLDKELQQILSVASVVGEIFIAQIVAEVEGLPESQLISCLSQQLERSYQLVEEQETILTNAGLVSYYKFYHALIRDYLYHHLGQRERQLLHGKVAIALEKLFTGGQNENAAQLAYHFDRAKEYGPAFNYLCMAADRAARIYAIDEAIKLYTRAIELIPMVSPDAITTANLRRGRGLVYEITGEFERSRVDFEAALQISQSLDESKVECIILNDLGKLWTSRDYQRSHDYYERALKLAQKLGEPEILANSLNRMGNWYLNAENTMKAIEFHQSALGLFEKIGEQRNLATTLDLLGVTTALAGDCSSSVRYFDRAIALFRELDDRESLASSLAVRGNLGAGGYSSLTIVPGLSTSEAQSNFDEALQIAREIGSRPSEAWVLCLLGYKYIVEGESGKALKEFWASLSVSSEIEHLEWVVASQTGFGQLYVELFAPQKARRQLEKALDLARNIHSNNWIHLITGTLASAYLMLGEFTQAHACLESVISSHTAMDTVHKRFCWVKLAELALYQGNPALTLEIIERLVNSASGMLPGTVIPFLWKLKGEALAALGNLSEAINLLRAAKETTQATGENFLHWRILASLGHLYKANNNPVESQRVFTESKELINKLAATIPEEELENTFRQGAYRTLMDFPYHLCMNS